ncbi:MAG: class I SAM-dependent methyltransferase [Thermodesulfobacteriota bacterium]|jgi:SAM-dependent methyltransferase
MDKLLAEKPDYGNWVSKKFVYIPGAISLLFWVVSFALTALVVVAAAFLLVALYFAYARYRFSPAGGDIQTRIQELVLQHLDWDGRGKALDIGCGNGPLTIKLAQKYAEARVTGIDYWGKQWEYSKSVCERNAKIEGVAQRVSFQKASASALPFEDECFDMAVSNLVFHEVRDTKVKRALIREALRVVKKQGRFAFQDLFLLRRVYGRTDDLLATVKSWGITKVEFVKTADSAFIPKALRLPFMVGTIGILYGEK